MKTTINETYYAIRVGDPRRHHCYLWVGADGALPKLFLTRADAENAYTDGWDDTPAKVVRVKIKTG